jgi:deoxyuridine 5'-triphosphate nucleotidohydrolase
VIPSSIYFASPVDQSGRWDNPGGSIVSWVDTMANIKNMLLKRFPGFLFDPSALFQTSTPHVGLFNILDKALIECDLFVAFLPAGVPTLGTPVEIEQAMRLGKPILLITDLQGTSWVVEKWVSRYDLMVVAGMARGPGIELHHAFEWVDLLPEPDQSMMCSPPPLWSDMVSSWEAPLMSAVDTEDTLMWMRLDGSAQAPRRAFPDDAGFDLSIITGCSIAPHHTVNMACGIAVQLPPWSWGMITGRSSIWQKGLHVPVSVIDAGWRGEIYVAAHNLTDRVVELKAGDRVGQLIVLANSSRGLQDIVEVTELEPHDRGVQGFGSTGR